MTDKKFEDFISDYNEAYKMAASKVVEYILEDAKNFPFEEFLNELNEGLRNVGYAPGEGEEIKGIRLYWVQYTPYFNDGDICEFHHYADELTTLELSNGDIIPPEDLFEWKSKEWEVFKAVDEKHSETIRLLAKKINSVPTDIMRSLGEGKAYIFKDNDGEICFELDDDFDHD